MWVIMKGTFQADEMINVVRGLNGGEMCSCSRASVMVTTFVCSV